MFSTIGKVFENGVTGLFMLIDSLVYWFLSLVFELFSSLAEAKIFTQDAYRKITDRFYVVIGVVMLFFLAYSLLKALVNPEELQKATNKIATNAIVALIMLSLAPTVFNYMFELQSAIVGDNIVGKLVFGDTYAENKLPSIGRKMAVTMLEAFIQIDDSVEGNNGSTWQETKSDIINGGSFSLITNFVEAVNEGERGASYTPIIGAIMGGFIIYVALSFCLDLGIRLFKLAFYQIMAPIPIMMQVIPEKKSVFGNYVKKTLMTFMEVFVRLFIMYAISFFVSIITDGNLQLMSDENLNLVAKIVIFLGLFAFAKQAPKLISDITGLDSGNIKLGIGGKIKESFNAMGSIPIVGGLSKRVGGAVTGGLGGAYASLTNGAGLSGIGYGVLNGWKGKGNQFGRQRNDMYHRVYGQDGEQGIFGGPSMRYLMANEAKAKAKKAYQNNMERNVENDPRWQTTYNVQESAARDAKIESVNNISNQINKVNEDLKKAFDEFKENQEKERATLQALLDNEKAEYENDKVARLKQLKNEARKYEKPQSKEEIIAANRVNREIADLENSTYENYRNTKLKQLKEAALKYENPQTKEESIEAIRINQEIANLENSISSHTALENKITEVNNRTFDDSSFKTELESLNNQLATAQASLRSGFTDEEIASIQAATRKALLKDNSLGLKYKAMVKYTDNVAREKENKKYLESDEGRHMAAAYQQAMEAINKNKPPMGGGKPPLGGGDKPPLGGNKPK